MRRLVLVHLVCCLGLVVPAAARAQTTTTPPSRRRRRRRPPMPQAKPTAAAAGGAGRAERLKPLRAACSSRRGGSSSSAGASAASTATRRASSATRTSATASSSPMRGMPREDPDGNWLFQAAADNVGWRDQRFFADYERPGRFVISGLWDRDPAVLQRRYARRPTPALGEHAGARRRDAARDPERAGESLGVRADRAAVRSPGAARHRQRELPGHADAAARREGVVHDQRGTCGELPWGASFGFSNDVEVALPYDSRTNDFTLGAEWTNSRNMLRVAYDGSWFDNLDDTLVWDSPLRLDDSTSAPGPRADGALAVELGADRERRRLHQVRAAHAAHRLRLVRVLEQRRAAAAVHHQHDAAAARAAESHAKPKPTSFRPT